MAPKKSRKKAMTVAKSKRRQPQARSHFQGGEDASAASIAAAADDERRREDEAEVEEHCGDRYFITQDYGEAARCYRRAAEMGHEQAQFNLGFFYEDGKGVPQDFAEAARWYRLSADQGHAAAQSNLGFLYLKGKGVPQDLDEARRLSELSAAKGYGFAFLALGEIYENGRGVEKNLALAKQYYRRGGKDETIFKSGQTSSEIMEEKLDTIKHTCAFCEKVGDDLKVCVRCKGPRYCGVACQKADWPEHKRVCQRLAKTEAADRMAQDANDA